MREYRLAYDAIRTINMTNFDYYLILRSSVMQLFAALGYVEVFRHPLIAADLCELITGVTGLALSPLQILS